MTAPYPPSAIGRTPIYQLPFLALGAPAKFTRAILEDVTRGLEAALARGGIAPPGVQELANLVGRVTTLEDPPVIRPALTTNWANYGAGWRPYEMWRVGKTAHLAGVVKPTVQIAAGASLALSGLAPEYAPSLTNPMGLVAVDGSRLTRLDITPAGPTLVNTTGGVINAGALVVLQSFWSLKAW